MASTLSTTDSSAPRNNCRRPESSIWSVFSKLNMTTRQSLSDTFAEKVPLRKDIETAFASVRGVIKASLRALPAQTEDDTYVALPESTGLLQDLQAIGFRDVGNFVEIIGAGVSGKPTNDRDYLMEKVIQLASDLPQTSKKGIQLTDIFVNELWNDLSHPPLSYLGENSMYRQADGSGNNIAAPHLGAAGSPYARTVRSQTIQPAALPDPGVLFDSVMVRKKFIPHPNKISSMLFYLASIIIHDLFRTDHHDFNKSLTSSYLDLSPLYGSNQDEQNAMRTFQDGKIKADCFSEKRLLGFPPGVGVLLISFNRFHNYVVQQLALVNESGRFTKPKEGMVEAIRKYDHDLFQTGRLVTCGLYVNCILKDYVRTILNLNRTDSVWDLDPRVEEGKTELPHKATEGIGNQVSAEFNLVYRWHAAISERDDQWTQQTYRTLFPDRDPKKVDFHELIQALGKWEATIPADPQKRTFGNLQRSKDGTFSNDAMVKILTESIEDVAGSFGANRVPEILRGVEILGIKQARSWNLATLNEFRGFFGLTKHKTFEDINSDPEVASQLSHLYDHPDLVELYPGLVVEEAKAPMVPGSGLCPSFTVSRAVLSDAVALVRGDRFYTTDYTPKNLTSWGFNEASSDITVDQGHVFYKLLIRAFPEHFRQNSVYAHFPLVVPSENKEILSLLNSELKYTWEKPKLSSPVIQITSCKACKTILDNQKDFKVTCGEPVRFLMETEGKPYGVDSALSRDNPANIKSRKVLGKAFDSDDWQQEIRTFYEQVTIDLLQRHSYKLAGVNQVDIVRDVGNIAHTRLSAEIFTLPLKTTKNPKGIYSEQELYMALSLIFACTFFDADPAKSFPLRQASRTLAQHLGKLLETIVEPINASSLLTNIVGSFQKHTMLSDYGVHMIQHLLNSGLDVKEVVWSQILPIAGAMVANQGQVFAQCLDYYLSKEGEVYLKEINHLAKLDTKEADETLLHYFMEGARLSSSVGVYRDVVSPITIKDGDKTVNLKPGHRILLNLVSASHDPKIFPSPNTVDITRPLNSYIQYSHGPHQCLGYEISKLGMTTMLKVVGRLDNLRRAPGPQGQIKQVTLDGGFKQYMTEGGESWWPFPTSLKINWDGDLGDLDWVSMVKETESTNAVAEVKKPISNGSAKVMGNGRPKRPGSVSLKTPRRDKKVAAAPEPYEASIGGK